MCESVSYTLDRFAGSADVHTHTHTYIYIYMLTRSGGALGGALGGSGGALGGSGELLEGLEEVWEALYIEKLPINRTAAVMLIYVCIYIYNKYINI